MHVRLPPQIMEIYIYIFLSFSLCYFLQDKIKITNSKAWESLSLQPWLDLQDWTATVSAWFFDKQRLVTVKFVWQRLLIPNKFPIQENLYSKVLGQGYSNASYIPSFTLPWGQPLNHFFSIDRKRWLELKKFLMAYFGFPACMSSYDALYQHPFHVEKAYFKTGCHAHSFPQSTVTTVLTSFSKSPWKP